MPNWIDIGVPVILFITLVWGFTSGYWHALVLLISILIGLVVGARFDSRGADLVERVLTAAGPDLVAALVFVVLTIVSAAIAAGIVGWLLGFARPTTHAARTLPSAHIFGGLFGLGFGVVLASVILMAAYLAASDVSGQAIPGNAGLRATLTRSTIAPSIWRLVHMEQRGLRLVLGPGTPPPFNVP